MTLYRDDRDQLDRLFVRCADGLGIDVALVEKDYWAIEALRAVAAGFVVTGTGGAVTYRPVFKGGTSLSKVHGLIHRFSEDIDLLVPVAGNLSNNQRSDVMKTLTSQIGELWGEPGERTGGRKGVDLHWRVPYETTVTTNLDGAAAVEPSVLVEVTVMGGDQPSLDAVVTSLAADTASELGLAGFDDLTAVEAIALDPRRTLVEKLAMLHDAATRATPDSPGRLAKAGRHYYDIAMLLSSDDVTSELTSDFVAEIAADADAWSALGKFPFTSRPDSGFAASPAFDLDVIATHVQAGYDAALRWVWSGPKPSLAECVAVIRRHDSKL